jgi:anti-sigma B factor antagonist
VRLCRLDAESEVTNEVPVDEFPYRRVCNVLLNFYIARDIGPRPISRMKYMSPTYVDEAPQPAITKNGESKLRLDLEIATIDGVMILSCRGRIVYRHEATALSAAVTRNCLRNEPLVLNLGGVEVMDSAGLGALVEVLQTLKLTDRVLKVATPQDRILKLLQLTNLTSVVEIFPSVELAVASCSEEKGLADGTSGNAGLC